jgi:hypothetical protein
MDLSRLPLLLAGACFAFAACSVSNTRKVDDDGSGGATSTTTTGSTSSGMTGMCEDTCIPMHPDGEADYRGLRSCLLCSACADACSNENGGVCDAPAEAGCSAMAGSCADCLGSACALEQLADTNFAGVCATQGAICSMNIACVGLNNCVANCAMGGASSSGVGGAGAGGAGAGGN